MWGSDWPFIREQTRIDYGPLLKLAEQLLPDAGVRRKVMSDPTPTVRLWRGLNQVELPQFPQIITRNKTMTTDNRFVAATLACPATQTTRTRTRFVILALISGGTMINYLDRSVVGIAAPSMSDDLGLNAVMMGVIFSAFSWTYTAAQIPGGILLDRLGTKCTYWLRPPCGRSSPDCKASRRASSRFWVFVFWSATAEAPCFPTNSRVVATWFPQASGPARPASTRPRSTLGWHFSARCSSGGARLRLARVVGRGLGGSALAWCGGASTASP